MSARFVCIHGHFYQPPRYDPWMKRIERQPSAFPFHDWDERVHRECYSPNTEALILDAQGKTIDHVNNYEYISFNFGPTILSWMEREDPKTYEKILRADQKSREHFGGFGSAIAQVYNHVILPLASARDKRLQVQWGLIDFKDRFGRDADGIWLAETAVDLATLEVLCDFGVKFTILSPYQSKVPGIDTRKPYLVKLPSGRSMSVFFYDGDVSRGIAFDGLLYNGDQLAERLKSPLASLGDRPGISLAATDGESYGHHHKKGEMALAYAIRRLQNDSTVQLTNLAKFLHDFPATDYAEIIDPSSWSCAHGVERWRSNCGCRVGTEFLDQSWRTPLRTALDGLKKKIADFVDDEVSRDAELASAIQALPKTFRDRSSVKLDTRGWKILQLERASQYMMTSCAWFFDEATGLEVRQNLKFAERAIELFGEFSPEASAADAAFLHDLSSARSHVGDSAHLAEFFKREIRPLRKDLFDILAQEFVIRRLNLKLRSSVQYASDFRQLGELDPPGGIEYWRGSITDFESAENVDVRLVYDSTLQTPKVYMCAESDFSETALQRLNEKVRTPTLMEGTKNFEKWRVFGAVSLGPDAERALLHQQISKAWNRWKEDYPRIFQSTERLKESDPIWNLSEALSRFTES